MIINYDEHTALETAINRVNDLCGFAWVNMYTEEFNPLSRKKIYAVHFTVNSDQMHMLTPDNAADIAEEITWVAAMARALESLDIHADFENGRHELDEDEMDALVHKYRTAIATGDNHLIWNALHG